MSADVEYHLRRARSERDIAYRSEDKLAADVHMRLSALHLARAILLRTVQCQPVGNVIPLRPNPAIVPTVPLPIMQSPSAR